MTALAACVALLSAQAAEIKVKGAGFLRDRELRVALNRLLDADERRTLDANAIEDAAVILLSAVGENGFQKPEIDIELTLPDGAKRRFEFDPTFEHPLPRPLEVDTVTFHVRRGVRSYIAQVEFTGLTAVPLDKARTLFRADATMLALERTNPYSPARVNRGVDALLSELRQRGYAEAEVRASKSSEENGAVTLRVHVKEGPKWQISALRLQHDDPDPPSTLPKADEWVGKAWTPSAEQDLREALRHAYYREGHPDVGVHIATEPGPPSAEPGQRNTTVVATLVPGPHVTVGRLRFEGNALTRDSVLRRRVTLGSGDPLNPLEIERGRYRISRLGVFESVDVHYEPEGGPVRDPVFVLHEGSRYETNLLFGYGSYEQFRGGVEYRQMNILGLAHQSRLELVQSVKSTSGDYSYTVPEIFGESIDGTAKLFGLRREEIFYVGRELGASFTLRRAIRVTGGDATVGYTFRSLQHTDTALGAPLIDERKINVASINVGLTGDRRDNRLRPRHGYHWLAQVEAAHPRFGGEATYQRIEVGGAYHTRWGGSRWIHAALAHGVIMTIGADDASLPVNVRFLPGGDSSIRGYQRGEAAPRDAAGLFVGAKSYLQFNLELEQAITPNWSVVAFGDALGTATTLRQYPYDERLYSAGLAVRYQTLIGPIRLEYGRNINRRAGDPSGTWHFAMGYPF